MPVNKLLKRLISEKQGRCARFPLNCAEAMHDKEAGTLAAS